MRIVYVEDEAADAMLVERYAHMTHHELVVASNIEDAQTAMESGPDLILVDLYLNKARSGYDLVRDLRERGFTQPIVAVTGLALENDIQQCFVVGCTEVLTKPYAITQLADLFAKYTV